MEQTPTPTAPEQAQTAAERFEARFGRPAAVAVAAPGRVNLIGEHTDYNDGFVLPMALDRRTVIAAAPRDDRRVRLASDQQEAAAEFELDPQAGPGSPKWANYVLGPVTLCLKRGFDPGGFDAFVTSNVPLGGGLSSSASLEVAAVTLVEALSGQTIGGVDKALIAQQAEHEYAGVPCGIMDQFISAMGQAGRAMLLDCRSHQTKMVPLDDANLAVMVVNSNVKHELAGGEYAERRSQCEQAAAALGVPALRDAGMAQLDEARRGLDDLAYQRARHVIGENQRTLDAAQAMQDRDWPRVGKLMFESHASLRDDFEVSCKELDVLVELAAEHRGAGVFGSRMTGGGFGGCTVTLLEAGAVDAVAAHIVAQYPKRTGLSPTIFITRPGEGAQRVSL